MASHHFILPPLKAPNALSLKERQTNFKWVLFTGNQLMLASLSLMLVCLFVAYVTPHHFGLTTQVISHFALILLATLIKIGYVLRLIGENGLQEGTS